MILITVGMTVCCREQIIVTHIRAQQNKKEVREKITMKKQELEREIKKEEFDVKTQYCDPNHCWHDCMLPGTNNCDSHKSTTK